jgi:hypothetical protein
MRSAPTRGSPHSGGISMIDSLLAGAVIGSILKS